MRVYPVSINHYSSRNTITRQKVCKPEVNFQGKNTCAKLLGGTFGVLGTLGAIGGTIIMTGGVAIPFVLGYGAACGGSGILLGHILDKGSKESNEDK